MTPIRLMLLHYCDHALKHTPELKKTNNLFGINKKYNIDMWR